MFENYPEYMEQILDAAAVASPRRKRYLHIIAASTVLSIICLGFVPGIVMNQISRYQVSDAISAVSGDLQSAPMDVQVGDSQDTGNTIMSTAIKATGGVVQDSGASSNISDAERNDIIQKARAGLTDDAISSAKGVKVDDDTYEITIKTSNGYPVKVTVKKSNGSYSIDSVVIQVAENQVGGGSSADVDSNKLSTDEQKASAANPLYDYDNAYVTNITGVSDASSLSGRFLPLGSNVLLVVPSGYSSQDAQQPEAKENLSGSAQNIVKPNATSWVSSDGKSMITTRVENLGEAFASMNGETSVSKMSEYWEETTSSIASGAGQSPTGDGYAVSVFYDSASDVWGYWANVKMAGDSRTTVYNRCVLISETTKQMASVTYRYDASTDDGGGMSLDDFKKLVMHAPGQSANSDAQQAYASSVSVSGVDK